MPSGKNHAAAIAAYVRTVAMFEAPKAEFQILQADIAETIHDGYAPAGATLAEEARLRSRLFVAVAVVSKRDRERSKWQV